MTNDQLPIYEIESALVGAAAKYKRLILQAPTGSGKSTQVPQMLLDHGLLGSGQVVVLQPRRLATRMLAARVAQERNVKLGGEVGYQIRFDSVTSRDTKIRFVTEGVLLRQMLSNPKLDGISALVFDEFHERHLYGDISLARALDVQEKHRPDLLLIVMSATLNAQQLEDYLNRSTADCADAAGSSFGVPASAGPPPHAEACTPNKARRCLVLESKGRTFPVDMDYLDRETDEAPWELAAQEFARAVRNGAQGDALIFMPGAYEISRTVDALRATSEGRSCRILPLHGELPERDQDAAVARYAERKIVVSTNVAETSLTIDGVRLVIDAGLARTPKFDPYRGINTLLIERISRASADQRAGRAGRTAPGRCIRLWTHTEHQGRPMQELPEIKRLDLAEVVLTLKASGVDDLRTFRWLDPPDPRSLERAETLLRDIGAIAPAVEETFRSPALGDRNVTATPMPITEVGRRMLAFPVHPRYSRMLIEAASFNCVYQIALIAALTQGRDLLLRRQPKQVEEARSDILGDEAPSDFFRLARAWNYAEKNSHNIAACQKLGIHAQSARQVRPLLENFLRIARDEGLNVEPRPVNDEDLQKCILTGFTDQLARRMDSGSLRCKLVHGRKGELARESAVHHSDLIVAAEVHEIEGRDRELNVLLTMATEVKVEWLAELFPKDFTETVAVTYDTTQKRVLAEKQKLFRDLVIESKRTDQPPPDAAAELLAKEVVAGRLTLKEWDHEVEQFILRVNFLAKHCPDLQITAITKEDEEHIVAQVCLGAVSYKDIKDKPVKPVLREWLNYSQSSLVDKHAPERLEMPNNRRAKITYVADGNPFLSARIQDIYDLRETPRIAINRVPLLMHILAPSQRPVQITQDLAGFWRDHYPRIKQELSRKYPKHEWR